MKVLLHHMTDGSLGQLAKPIANERPAGYFEFDPKAVQWLTARIDVGFQFECYEHVFIATLTPESERRLLDELFRLTRDKFSDDGLTRDQLRQMAAHVADNYNWPEAD